MSSAESGDQGNERPPDLVALQADLAAADRDADPVLWGLLSVAYGHALHSVGTAHFVQAEQAYRDALTVFHREDHPARWYTVSLMLAHLLAEGRPADVPAEPALREAAAIVSELSSEAGAAPRKEVHAAALGLRAEALTELAEHDPASYEAACQAQRATVAAAQPVEPHVFADASLALAELLLDHDGDKSEAIAALEQALTFYRADDYPAEWIRCHWYLGRLLAGQAVSCSDLTAARAHIEDVVTVKPPLVVPAFYALACAELSRLLDDQRCPEDKERLDRAISWSEECLKYWPEDDLGYRSGHAAALADGYQRRAETSHDNADLARAVALLAQAAQWARQAEAADEDVVELAYDAAAVRLMIRTDRRENLEAAIEQLTELLNRYGAQLPAGKVAVLRQTLGTAYLDRIVGDQAGNQERAIENLEAALSALDRGTSPDRWASAANNLSNAYWKRVRGDHGENLEKAIAYAQAALTIRTRDKDPQLWARTVHVLGNLYYQRPLGDKSDNVEKSIRASLAATEVETKEALPARWAGAQRNLGNAYLLRALGNRRENVEKAVSCFRGSLSVTPSDDPKAYGESLFGLGNALGWLGTETGDQSVLAEAVTAYQQAAAAFGELGSADQQAMANFNLAVILSQSPGTEQAARAEDALRKCLPTWNSEGNPLRASRAYEALATVTDRLGRTAEAYDWACRAIEANETLFAGATADDSKIELIADSANVYLHAVDLALRSGAAVSEALLLAERGRTRMLRQTAVRLQPDWRIPAELRARESELIAERRRAWEGMPGGDPASEIAERDFAQVQALTEQLAGLWKQIRGYPGGNEYVTARKGAITWAQIRHWVDTQPVGFALLEYVVLPGRVVAFVIRQDEPEPAVVDIPLGAQALRRCAQALYREMDGSTAGRVRTETWDRLALPLVTLVQPELAGARLLCVVPHIVLHGFPMHALGARGATLLDQMAVYYAPSAALAIQLSQGARRSGRLASVRAMVAGDSLGDLSYARLEAERIGQLLGVQPLIGERATLAAVLAQLPDADLAHFACHGYLRVDQPALSAIVLADGALTAGQLQRTELRCDVLVLSGCDTGFQPVERTLDVGGLPSALIEAGASTAIGGLWAVNDKATQELFTHFYTELARAGAQRPGGDEIATSVAGCLRAAELALRKTRPERYFWAPFIAVGSW